MNKSDLIKKLFQEKGEELVKEMKRTKNYRLLFETFFEDLPLCLLPELRRQSLMSSRDLRKDIKLHYMQRVDIYRDELYRFLLEKDK